MLTGIAAHDKAGPGADALVRGRRARLRLRRAVLRRVRLHGARGRLGLHLRLRHAGRAVRLDHRLGPDPRVRGRLGHRGPRLVALLPGLHRHLRPASCPQALADRALRLRPGDRAASSPPAPSSTCRPSSSPLIITVILVKGIRESATLQRRHGRHQAGDRAVRHRRRRLLRRSRPTGSRSRRSADRASASSATPSSGQTGAGGEPLGMLAGAAIIFFAYIGFDSVSTHAEEAQQPAARRAHRHHRLADHLHGALHRRVAAVLTGMVPYDQINIDAPVSDAFAPGRPAVGAVPHLARAPWPASPRCSWS